MDVSGLRERPSGALLGMIILYGSDGLYPPIQPDILFRLCETWSSTTHVSRSPCLHADRVCTHHVPDPTLPFPPAHPCTPRPDGCISISSAWTDEVTALGALLWAGQPPCIPLPFTLRPLPCLSLPWLLGLVSSCPALPALPRLSLLRLARSSSVRFRRSTDTSKPCLSPPSAGALLFLLLRSSPPPVSRYHCPICS